MGLQSAMSTALTGLTAAETTIDVVGNNLANSNTVGFKGSEANFATQFLQTQSLGSGPTAGSGGTNPRQIGLGTLVAEITPDFNQGTIEISSNPMDLAIQGDGFFITQGGQGEQLFTRNGIFKLNSDNEIVSITGNRLLGYGIDDQFQVQTTTLVPIQIPIGSAAVAQATQNVYLEGTLSPTGDLSDTAEIIQTGVLGDALYTAPPTGTALALSSAPDVTATAGAGSATGGGLTGGTTYLYRVVFADGTVPPLPDVSNTEGTASANVTFALGALDDTIDLSNVPTDATGNYSRRHIYRSNDGGTTFNYLGQIGDNVTTTYNDVLSDAAAAANPTLDTSLLNGSYSYYVTFFNSLTGIESRPTPVIGPQTAAAARIQLRSIPIDGSGQWDRRRVYRNLATDDSTFYRVAEISDNLATTFTDSASDVTVAATPQIDLDGAKITDATLLTSILRRDGATYNPVFQQGTLSFVGKKGGRSLTAKELTVDATTNVQELYSFMADSMGIRSVPGPDPLNPIPDGDPDPAVTLNPGGRVTAGQIRLVGNNGVDNALDIGLSGMTLTTAAGSSTINMPFSSAQAATGESAVGDFIAYDTLGIPLAVRVTTVLESRDATSTTYRWFADAGENDPSTGVDIAVGTGLMSFDGEGNFVSATESTVSIQRENVSSASPLEFDLDFSQLSGLQTDNSSLAISRQDGAGAGVLTSYIVGEDGAISGVFSNGMTRALGQIRLARFANPAGLEQKGENMYRAGVNSGLPLQGDPGQQGIGSIIAGATELSNTDVGSNLIDLILASTMYRGNTRVITTAQQMLDELLSLRR
ncbi:MAG: flagellar hook-basal body complex protein [Candidatus Nealsonbacteria bacterium]|nr:flagellar hook-basal body complex protein [Candidatus Nealsonbacteria bacterium]